MAKTDDSALDDIIKSGKPGFIRVARSGDQDALLSASAPAASTPDIDVLHQKARTLVSKLAAASKDDSAPSPARAASIFKRFLAKDASAEPSENLMGGASAPDQIDDSEIVGLTPKSGPTGADGTAQKKTVVISRSARKIIGEQG